MRCRKLRWLSSLSGIDAKCARAFSPIWASTSRRRERLDEVGDDEANDLRIETATEAVNVRFPAALREGRVGVGATSYALLENVVLGDWLREHVPEGGVSYYKEGTGEDAALERGDGDVLFRMQPVDREEFQAVVQGGEVYPHKTTYFYPKLWSGLALWRLAEVE